MLMRNLFIKMSSFLLVISLLLITPFSLSGCSNEIKASEFTTEASQTTEETTSGTTSETTEETEPSFNQLQIEVDFYKIPELYSNFITEEDYEAYEKIVTAWLNYEPMVEIENLNHYEYIWGMIQECFFLAYGDFDEEAGGFIVQGDCIHFNYVTESKEEHDEIIRAFKERVVSFFDGIDESEEGIRLAHHLYYNYNRTLAYDYDVYENENYTFANSSGYTALMYGSGVCMSFAKGYSYLARQAGFEAFDVSGGNHEWGAIKIEDKYYFVDSTWDYIYDFRNYQYFCFGLDSREADGYSEEEMHVCCNGDLHLRDYVIIEREGYYD